MIKQELCQVLHQELGDLYNTHEINNLANYFWQYAKTMMVRFPVNLGEILSSPWYGEWVSQLRRKLPIQYIAGTAPFLHLEIAVNPAVLIPRPETEELAAWIHLENSEKHGLKILDVGTGSGCLALYLKDKHPDWEVTGLDSSEMALQCAANNAKRLHLDIQFLEIDFLQMEAGNLGTWDLIVSNPPYIARSEGPTMDALVLQHEPEMALFVPGSDPLVFYRKLMWMSVQRLNPGGSMYCELSEFHALEVAHLFDHCDELSHLLKEDFYGKPRFLKAWKTL